MTAIDRTGVVLAAACVVHCVALPFVAVVLPLFGTLSEMESVHKSLAVFAAIAALFGFARPLPMTLRKGLRTLAAVGALILLVAAFVEPMHDHETLLTVVGASLLGTAHILRSRRFHKHTGEHVTLP